MCSPTIQRMDVHDDSTGRYWDQAGFDARCEWGEEGVRRLAPGAAVVVIVDVLSFSTCVAVATERGAAVLPYRWRDDRAEAFAARAGAHLAVHRRSVSDAQPYSLSPATLTALQPGDRLVLPSPNGATLAVLAGESGATVFAGSLRNAEAVARAARATGGTIAVIAAGERWPGTDDGLRPAVEDLVGAGAILKAWQPASPSPEALVAISAFDTVQHDIPGFLRACSSGRELIEFGYPEDVEIAGQLDASSATPRLDAGMFVAG
jgi:2-phosphosulfolactate phosphatase